MVVMKKLTLAVWNRCSVKIWKNITMTVNSTFSWRLIDTVNQQEMTIYIHEDIIVQLEDKIAQLQSTPMKFKITNFDELKKSNERDYSPAFYTSPGGYKMCIKVICNGNGDGEDTHVSSCVCLPHAWRE